MRLAELWAEVEQELEWRHAELRFFHNEMNSADLGEAQNRFRRIMVLTLYAHVEGFTRFIFSLYLKVVNGLGLRCHSANPALAAATLRNVLAALRDPHKKSSTFRKALPDDVKLHLSAREREFVEQAPKILSQHVEITDRVIDLESNLRPVVMRKNLYKLGLPHDLFEALEGDLHRLVNVRNAIAHGAKSQPISSSEYEKLRSCVFHVMSEMRDTVLNCVARGDYLRRGGTL